MSTVSQYLCLIRHFQSLVPIILAKMVVPAQIKRLVTSTMRVLARKDFMGLTAILQVNLNDICVLKDCPIQLAVEAKFFFVSFPRYALEADQ